MRSLNIGGISLSKDEDNETIIATVFDLDQEEFEKCLRDLVEWLPILRTGKIIFQAGGNLVLPNWFIQECKKAGKQVEVSSDSREKNIGGSEPTEMSEIFDKIIAYLNNFKSNESLSRIYQWPIDKAIDELEKIDTNSPISIDRKGNTFEKTLTIRNIVKSKLNNNLLSEEEEIAYVEWIVRVWGGITTGDSKTLLKKINNNDFGFDGIASRSKYLSFKDPDNYAIYDARVIYSLNWLLFKFGANIFFPAPPGRNSLMAAFDYIIYILAKHNGAVNTRNEINKDITNRNKNPAAKSRAITNLKKVPFIKKNDAYLRFCELLKVLAINLFGKNDAHSLTKTEMILFAIADKDIALDVFGYINKKCLLDMPGDSQGRKAQ